MQTRHNLLHHAGSSPFSWMWDGALLFHEPCVRGNGIAALPQEHSRLMVTSSQADITRLALSSVPKMCTATPEPRKHHGCFATAACSSPRHGVVYVRYTADIWRLVLMVLEARREEMYLYPLPMQRSKMCQILAHNLH